MFFCYPLLLLVICLVLGLYLYLKKCYSFFEQHGIPYIRPTLLYGNMRDVILFRKSFAEGCAELYNKLEPHKLGGIFLGPKPFVLIRDPDLLKDILIKDFEYFTDRGWNVDKNSEPLSHHLFTMRNDDWKSIRIKLTEAFTPNKMKMMFPLVQECGENLDLVLRRTLYDDSFEAKDLSARYTTDVIGSCAFGLQGNSLNDTNSHFRSIGKKILTFRLKTLLRMLQINIPQILIKLLGITVFDLKTQQLFGDIIYKTIDYREKNNVKRNDLLDILINLKTDEKFTNHEDYVKNAGEDLQKFLDQVGVSEDDKKTDIKITNEVLAAQAFIFYLAGFDASSTNLTFLLLELAQNKQIQEKVRKEIHDVIASNNGQITYDALKQMTYTDMVFEETLRKYPSLGTLQRRAVKNYKVRDSDIVIPAGTSIIVSVYGLHLDDKYFDNPQEFRPERFTDEEKAKIANNTYIPFGGGPRYCIASRFAKMIVKVGLIHALKNYSYQVSPNMKFPVEFDKNFGLLIPQSKILLQRKIIE